jgi:hypothetical protein
MGVSRGNKSLIGGVILVIPITFTIAFNAPTQIIKQNKTKQNKRFRNVFEEFNQTNKKTKYSKMRNFEVIKKINN